MKNYLSKKYDNLRSIIRYYYSCWLGPCPTSKEVDYDEIKNLANRLKTNSKKETLTNILEWQNNNIEFWTERHPIATLLFPIPLLLFIIGLIISYIFHIQIVLWNFWFTFIVFPTSIFTNLFIISFILSRNRKIPVNKLINGFRNVLLPSISMSFLLENKLCICRDYAKLTASLILNIYPNEDVYFASAPGHVATGIMIETNLYMLDQRLPMLTYDKWSNYRKVGKYDKIERFIYTNHILQTVDKNNFLPLKNNFNLDIEKIALDMADILSLRKQKDSKMSKELKILWKNGAMLYKDDEIVNYSLARLIKMKASDELIALDEKMGIRVEHKNNDKDIIFYLTFY